MTTFSNFEEIRAWGESRILVRCIREICKRPNVRTDFSFIDQITRAARSISANIAEGNDALTVPDFIKFLSISKKSAAEVRSHLYDALDEKYCSQTEFLELSDLTKKICSMLAQLIRYLQNTNQRHRIHPKAENEKTSKR